MSDDKKEPEPATAQWHQLDERVCSHPNHLPDDKNKKDHVCDGCGFKWVDA